MRTENFQETKSAGSTYGEVLSEVIDSTKDVIRSEINLFATEFNTFLPKFTKHAGEAVAFGWLLALSVVPFLAFLVIGLGELLEGRYWLSSLIVSVVCALIGGPLSLRAFRKIKNEDFKFTQTKISLDKALHSTREKVDEVKAAAKGDRYEQNSIN